MGHYNPAHHHPQVRIECIWNELNIKLQQQTASLLKQLRSTNSCDPQGVLSRTVFFAIVSSLLAIFK